MPKTALILAFLALFAAAARPQQQLPPAAGDLAPGANFPQPRPDKDGVYFAVPGIITPVVIDRAPVEYPANAPDSAVEGMTVLKLVVSEEGTATDIEVVASHGDAFDRAAIDALQRCKFDPATLNGKPVPIHIFARVRFFEDKRETYPRILAHYGLGAGIRAPSTRNFDQPPVPLNAVPAEYSDKARKAKVQGVVLVSTMISDDGSPTDIKVVKGLGMGLDEKAVEAVSKYRFRPAMKDGEPVAARITIEVNFRLY
jgi:TonB family protein